jgi:hypothetical protein
MPATLTHAQLLSALTEQQVQAVESYWDAGAGQDDPVAEEIAAALARVDAYTAGWAPSPELLTGWARAIAAWHILARMDLATEAHAQAKDTALEELRAVRAGEFPGIARAANAVTGAVAYGGRDKIL